VFCFRNHCSANENESETHFFCSYDLRYPSGVFLVFNGTLSITVTINQEKANFIESWTLIDFELDKEIKYSPSFGFQ
jgi:hypothetical protein